MGTKALVALDINHIKQYVFATDKLKEIRGASSRLDCFNRETMWKVARSLDEEAHTIYTNGGSGLFLLEEEQTRAFVEQIQRECRTMSGDAASVTCVIQPLPPDTPATLDAILNFPLPDTLALLRSRLRMEKGYPPEILALPSHPFLSPCQACGVFYAEQVNPTGGQDPDEEDALYCESCLLKRKEDMGVKRFISAQLKPPVRQPDEDLPTSSLWQNLLDILRDRHYDLPPDAGRPRDLNVFQGVTKNYIGLIYADANGMGKKIEGISTLGETKAFAEKIDAFHFRSARWPNDSALHAE